MPGRLEFGVVTDHMSNVQCATCQQHVLGEGAGKGSTHPWGLSKVTSLMMLIR